MLSEIVALKKAYRRWSLQALELSTKSYPMYSVYNIYLCNFSNKYCLNQTDGRGRTEPRKGHFFSNIYQKRNRIKKNKKGNQNNNITFKPLFIFPCQYIAEKKLKQEYWKGNQNKIISFYRLNISFIQHNAGLQLVDFFTNGRPGLY